MPMTVVTKATGGSTKPVGVLHIEPALQVLNAGAGTALESSWLVPASVAPRTTEDPIPALRA